MAFSTMLQGEFGDEMLNSATKPGNLALGTRMILPDGREFRLCKNGAVALVGGLFNTGALTVPVHESTNATAITAGSRAITVAGSFSSSASAYADGFVGFKQGTGIGTMYSIKSSTASSSSSTTLTIHKADGAIATVAIGGTDIDVYPSPFTGMIVNPTDAQQIPTCVAVRAVSVSYYYWGQIAGPCYLRLDASGLGTELDEKCVIASTNDAGAGLMVASPDSSTVVSYPVLAWLMHEGDATDNECHLVMLKLT